MKKIFLLSLLLLFFATEAAAATKLEGLKVFTDSKGEMLEFKFNFSEAFEGQVSTSFYEKSVQVDLTGVVIEPSNRNFSVSDEYIQSVRALQYQKDVVRLRFNLVKNNIDLEEAFKHIGSGNELTFFLNKSKVILPGKSISSKAPVEKQEPIKTPVAKAKDDSEFDEKFANIASMMSGVPETGVAYAAETGPKSEKELSAVPDIYSSALKMFFYLSIILAALYFVLKALKKKGVVGGTKSIFGKDKSIRVIERTYIDNKKSLAIAEVCGEYMVLGVGEESISFIGKLDEAQKAKYIAEKEEKPEPVKSSTSEMEPAKKSVIASGLANLLKGKKSEEAFMELLAQKFTAYEEPKKAAPITRKTAEVKPVEPKEEKTSMIAEINQEKEEIQAQKVLEMLKKKAVAMQSAPAQAPKRVAAPPAPAPVQKEVKPAADLVAQDYFAKKSQLKFV